MRTIKRIVVAGVEKEWGEMCKQNTEDLQGTKKNSV